MKKEVYVVFSDYPFGTNSTAEKLRMTVGLTLNDDNKINLAFLGSSRHALQKVEEEAVDMNPITKHISMLSKLGASIKVESGGDYKFIEDIKPEIFDPADFDALLEKADVVIH